MPSERSPVDVVQAQLEAYNCRDIDRFCALFAEDAQLFELGATNPATVGKPAIRARYQALFDQSPNLLSVVHNRSTIGRAVVDLERITGRNGSEEPVEFLAIYEVESGLIIRVHFVRS
jgi:hypothetical protein